MPPPHKKEMGEQNKTVNVQKDKNNIIYLIVKTVSDHASNIPHFFPKYGCICSQRTYI